MLQNAQIEVVFIVSYAWNHIPTVYFEKNGFTAVYVASGLKNKNWERKV